MLWMLAIALAIDQEPPSARGPIVRTYHEVPLEQVAATRLPHICTVGPVVYVRKQQDGDWHITLDNGKAKVVAEIIPLIPLAVPRKGQTVKVCGIRRYDDRHRWYEVHPVELPIVVLSTGVRP